MIQTIDNLQVEDVQMLCNINPLAAEQLRGILKDRRIAELEAQLAAMNGKKEKEKIPVEES